MKIKILTHKKLQVKSTRDKLMFNFIYRHMKNNHQQDIRGTEENYNRKS